MGGLKEEVVFKDINFESVYIISDKKTLCNQKTSLRPGMDNKRIPFVKHFGIF